VLADAATPEQLNQLSKVTARVEIVWDYADLEKVRDLLKELFQSV
jgi:hypothetical protein